MNLAQLMYERAESVNHPKVLELQSQIERGIEKSASEGKYSVTIVPKADKMPYSEDVYDQLLRKLTSLGFECELLLVKNGLVVNLASFDISWKNAHELSD